MDSSDLRLDSPVLMNHDKHPRGLELIQTYMERDFPLPDNFDHYAYVSQLVQAYGMKTALEAHRRAKPRCMGTLYWQLNDCWPVISWSSIDSEGRWKAFHYESRRIYSDYLISFEQQGETLALCIVSDKYIHTEAMLELVLMDFAGNVQWKESIQASIPANSSGVYLTKNTEGIDKTGSLLVAALGSGQEKLAESLHYFARPRELNLPDPVIDLQIADLGDGTRITLTSGMLAKNVCIQCDEPGFFTDNYFDLLPHVPREVLFLPGKEAKRDRNVFKVIQLADISAK
jgi:beta-mannosidase